MLSGSKWTHTMLAVIWLGGLGFITLSPAIAKNHPTEKPIPKVLVSGAIDRTTLQAIKAHFSKSSSQSTSETTLKLITIPIRNNKIPTLAELTQAPSCRIGSNGSFRFFLKVDSDWLFLVAHTADNRVLRPATPIAFKIQNFQEPLPFFPASASSRVYKLNLGRISGQGALAICKTPLKSKDFPLTPPKIARMTTAQDYLAQVLNFLHNSNLQTQSYYFLKPDFTWAGKYSDLASGMTQPSTYRYHHYGFQLDANLRDLSFTEIYGTSTTAQVLVELVPPLGAKVPTADPELIYSSEQPVSNKNPSLLVAPDGSQEVWGDDFYANERTKQTRFTFGFNLAGDAIAGGLWQYRVGGITKAEFELSKKAPNTSEGGIHALAPSLGLQLDQNGKIMAVKVKWYLPDPNFPGKFSELKTWNEALADNVEIVLENQSTGSLRSETLPLDPTRSEVQPQQSWFYAQSGPVEEQAEAIILSYESEGIGYYFMFSRPADTNPESGSK